MQFLKNVALVVLSVAALLALAPEFAAQRLAPSTRRAPVSAPALGMIGIPFGGSALVFDANTDTVIGSVALGIGHFSCLGDCAITADLSTGFVGTGSGRVWIVDLTTSPPSLASGPNPLVMPNLAEDLVLSSDGRFLIVCDGSADQPVAVVELATRTVVGTFSTGYDCVSVEACPDGSVLVASDVLDFVKRLSLDSSGQLADTGEILPLISGSIPVNLACARGGTTGVLLLFDSRRVQSFGIPGLVPIDNQLLATVGQPFSCALDERAGRVYVRGQLDLEAFAYDGDTGVIGNAPLWSVPLGSGHSCYGVEQDALHPDGSRLYVPVPGRIEIRDPATGAQLDTIEGVGDASGVCIQRSEALVASLDIRPGACPNSFNRTSHGVLPVALLGSDEIDVTQVDVATLRLARADGVGGSVAPNEGPPGPHTEVSDVATPFTGAACDCLALGGDGVPDLSAKFRSDALVAALQLEALSAGALVELVLTGELLDGRAFSASDCVRLVPPGTPAGRLTMTTGRGYGWIDVTPPDKQLDGGGFDRFERSYPLGSIVTLTAPAIDGLQFVAWEVDGVRKAPGERTLLHTVQGEHATLEAVYLRHRTMR